MKRDFTETTIDSLKQLLDDANSDWASWTNAIGDWCLSHGFADAVDLLTSTENYQSALKNQNESCKVNLSDVYELVQTTDTFFGNKYLEHTENLAEWHNELRDITEVLRGRSDYVCSTATIRDSQVTSIDLSELLRFGAGTFGQVGGAELIGAEYMAAGKIWIDSEGNLCMDGSAEAAAYLANFVGKTEFEIAGVKFNAEGKAFLGAKASAEAMAYVTLLGPLHGFAVSARAEAMAGASVEGSVGTTFFDGVLAVGVAGSAFAGARASADAGAAFDPAHGRVGAHAYAEAFAGVEASIEPSMSVNGVTAGCELGVTAGVGGHIGGGIGAENGHVKIELDFKFSVGVGIHIKPSLDIDVGSAVDRICDFWSGMVGFFS